MNKKLIIILLSFILIVFIIIKICFNMSPNHYNDLVISNQKFEEIIHSKKENKSLNLDYLMFNNYKLIYDDNTSTYYYSIVDGVFSFNPFIKYNDPYSVKFLKGINNDTILNNESIPIILYNDDEYNVFYLKCTTLPIINISYDASNTIEYKKDINMRFYIFDNSIGSVKRELFSDGIIHMRGATSQYYPKNSYKLSLRYTSTGNNTRNNKVSLLGMRNDDDWILYAPYNDTDKVRNVFSSILWYESSAKNNSFNINNGDEYKYVELFFNNHYYGLYALGFPIDDKQLDLKENEYTFNKVIYNNVEDELLYKKFNELPGYEIKSNTTINDNTWNIINNYFKTLKTNNDINILYSLNDINNAIDYYIFLNLIQGVDQTDKNTIISFKMKNDKYIALYTPWDMDQTFGNIWQDFANNNIDKHNGHTKNVYQKNGIINYIAKYDSSINTKITDRYKELRGTYYSDESIIALLDSLEKDIFFSGAYLREKDRWPEGNYNETNNLTDFKKYVLKRLAYLDTLYK